MEKWSPRICLAWESIWYSSFGIQVIIRSFSNRSHPRAPQQQRIPFVHLKNIREGFSKHSSWPQPLMARIENTFKMKWPIFLLYLPTFHNIFFWKMKEWTQVFFSNLIGYYFNRSRHQHNFRPHWVFTAEKSWMYFSCIFA